MKHLLEIIEKEKELINKNRYGSKLMKFAALSAYEKISKLIVKEIEQLEKEKGI